MKFVDIVVVLVLGLVVYWGLFTDDRTNARATSAEIMSNISFRSDDISAANKQIAFQAVKALINDCPNFKQYWPDVVGGEIQVTVYPDLAYPYMERLWGWTRFIDVELVIQTNETLAPAEWRMWGHHLFYEMGAGDAPGFVARKPQSVHFCNSALTVDENGDSFYADAAFQVVDRLQ